MLNLKNGLLWLFIISTIVISQLALATEKVGEVVIVQGKVVATAEDKTIRELVRGGDIYLKDKLTTNENSKIQIKLLDNTVFSLRTNTEMVINSYMFKIDKPETNNSVISLIKGGFRNVTGLISKQNPAHYKVDTPVALIGVRGTDYTAVLSSKAELFVSIWRGLVSLSNNAGVLVVGRGAAFSHAMIPSRNALPQGLTTPPAIIIQCP